MTWNPWTSVAGGVTLPGAPITALPSVKVGAVPGEELAVFVADPSGVVYATGGTPDGGWGEWAPVCDRRTLPGAPVGAAKLPLPINEIKEQFALFIADPQGAIYATSGDPQEGWWCWENVPGVQALPAAPVTAANWGEGAAVLVADARGSVYALGGNPGGGWRNWGTVCEGLTLPGAPITALPLPTAVQRSLEEIALFMADRNGAVYATSGTPMRWRCWGSVSNGLAAPGSKVTAVRWTDQQFALFVVNAIGGLYTIAGTPWGGWQQSSWSDITQGINANPRSGIAAVKLPGGTNQLAAVITTFDTGEVMYSPGDPQQGFQQGWPDANFQAANGASVTAVAYGGDPPNGAALFATNPQGEIYATSWTPRG